MIPYALNLGQGRYLTCFVTILTFPRTHASFHYGIDDTKQQIGSHSTGTRNMTNYGVPEVYSYRCRSNVSLFRIIFDEGTESAWILEVLRIFSHRSACLLSVQLGT
jgi:hypothetical protein